MHEADGPTASPVFHAAARAPRLLQPARQVLGDDTLYVHHTKCNLKTAIDGSVRQWHQDYGSWRRDGVPAPDPTTALVMLDEPMEMSGCLCFIPGSHTVGDLEPEMDDRTTSYRLWVVPKERLLEIVARSPEPVPITGRPGAVVFFHCNILHAPGTTCRGTTAGATYFAYDRVANRPLDVPNPRPGYVRSTKWAPLPLGTDDILAPAAAE